MNPREALLAAADHIQSNPSSYNFGSVSVPTSTQDGPACMVGWACHFAGQRRAPYHMDSYLYFGRHSSSMWMEMTCSTAGAMNSSSMAATALRHYADKHYPHIDVYEPSVPVWAQMLDRETQARIDAAPAYGRFRHALDLRPLLEVTPENKDALNHVIRDWSEE